MAVQEDESGENGSRSYVNRRSLGKGLLYNREYSSSSSSAGAAAAPAHVVVVMDALKELSMETLGWTLQHVVKPGYLLTLLGVMPWLSLPLLCKTWLHIWTLNLDNLEALRERSEWTNDSKYQKVREILELCDKYGVVPRMKVTMGHPQKLLVLEQTTHLNAAWVVFDRHHQKDKDFYAQRMRCNVVMMNKEGEFDMLLNVLRPSIADGDTTVTPGDSPATTVEPLIPKVVISKQLMNIISKNKDREKENSNLDIEYVI